MAVTDPAPNRESGWRARPRGALALRAAIVLVPLGAGVAAGVVTTRLADPQTDGDLVLAWILGFVVSNIILLLLSRQARRFLPLAALLELSLTFPDRTPSRLGVALRAGNLRQAESRRHALHSAKTAGTAEAIKAVLALATALSTHDRRTRGHSERVRAYTELLGDELHLPKADRDRLRWASLLHDVGKMEVPPATLNKPGALDDDEWQVIRQHPVHGARLVTALEPWLGHWAAVVEQHHERWDGGGYPNGLAGDDIHRGARMVAVADAYEVMTAVRPYKKPLPAAEARRRLTEGAGTQFDPGMVRAFLRVGMGRLRLVAGPLAWLAQVPFLRRLDIGASTPSRVALGAMATAAAVSVAVATLPPEPAPSAGVAAPAGPLASMPSAVIELSRRAPEAAAASASPRPVPPPPASTLSQLAAADPAAMPAPASPPPDDSPHAPTDPAPPHQPAPTPLVQAVAGAGEPAHVVVAVGVGEGGCTGLAFGDAVAGCDAGEPDTPLHVELGGLALG